MTDCCFIIITYGQKNRFLCCYRRGIQDVAVTSFPNCVCFIMTSSWTCSVFYMTVHVSAPAHLTEESRISHIWTKTRGFLSTPV